LAIELSYATAGTLLTALTFDLPSDCPAPNVWSSQTGASVKLQGGSGLIQVTNTTGAVTLLGVSLRRNSGDTGFEFNTTTASGGSYIRFIMNFQYITAN
jgi:hypothetical protein